jgi:hypothetical protein
VPAGGLILTFQGGPIGGGDSGFILRGTFRKVGEGKASIRLPLAETRNRLANGHGTERSFC